MTGQTAWTAVNYFDRYVSLVTDVVKRDVELLSLTCLLIASKYMECRSPSLEDLCLLAQHRLTKESFKQCELRVLNRLNWDLHIPSPHAYLEHLVNLVQLCTRQQRHAPAYVQRHAEFFVDLSSFEFNFLKLPLSTVASAALLCACRQLADPDIHGAVPDGEETVAELTELFGLDRAHLVDTADSLMACYHSCIRDEQAVSEANAATPTGNNVFVPVNEKDEKRSEAPSPDSVISTPVPVAKRRLSPASKRAAAITAAAATASSAEQAAAPKKARKA